MTTRFAAVAALAMGRAQGCTPLTNASVEHPTSDRAGAGRLSRRRRTSPSKQINSPERALCETPFRESKQKKCHPVRGAGRSHAPQTRDPRPERCLCQAPDQQRKPRSWWSKQKTALSAFYVPPDLIRGHENKPREPPIPPDRLPAFLRARCPDPV